MIPSASSSRTLRWQLERLSLTFVASSVKVILPSACSAARISRSMRSMHENLPVGGPEVGELERTLQRHPPTVSGIERVRNSKEAPVTTAASLTRLTHDRRAVSPFDEVVE